MSSAAQKLRELERDGIIESRNRHFEQFQRNENRAAINLHRRLNHLGTLLKETHARGELQLSLDRVDGHVSLDLEIKYLHGRYVARLHIDELRMLLRDPGVRDAFAAAQLPTEF